MKRLFVIVAILLVFTALSSILAVETYGQTEISTSEPIHVQVGAYIISVQSINLASSNYQLDFYVWFNFDPSQINATQVAQFEFNNGAPTVKQIDATDGYIEYRVTGTFIKTFDFTNYPFESHTLYIDLEHQNLDNTKLVYDIDPASYIEPAGGLAGWITGNITSTVLTHTYGTQSFSRPQFAVTLSKPLISGVIKSVLPISIITGISLLAFALSAEDYSQKLALGITTLLSATAFHLSLTSGIPSTGLTLGRQNDDWRLHSLPLQHRFCSLPHDVSAQRQERSSYSIQ